MTLTKKLNLCSGLHQQRGGENGQAWRVQAHHHGVDAQHDVQGNGASKEHQSVTFRRRKKSVKAVRKTFGSHRVQDSQQRYPIL